MHGVVAELLSVPQEYERAVESALGSALQNIVVPTEHDAKYLINYLREHDYGRATLLPVTAMRARLLTDEEKTVFAALTAVSALPPSLCAFRPNTAAFLKTFSAERSLFAILTPEFLSADVRNRHFALQR